MNQSLGKVHFCYPTTPFFSFSLLMIIPLLLQMSAGHAIISENQREKVCFQTLVLDRFNTRMQKNRLWWPMIAVHLLL